MRNWKSTVMMLTISVLPAERSLIPIVVCSFISDRPSACCQPSEQNTTAFALFLFSIVLFFFVLRRGYLIQTLAKEVDSLRTAVK